MGKPSVLPYHCANALDFNFSSLPAMEQSDFFNHLTQAVIAIRRKAEAAFSLIVHDYGIPVNTLCESCNGHSLLSLCCYYGFVEGVRILLAKGARLDLPVCKGHSTALHVAVSKNEIACAELLLSHGADVNAKLELGYNAVPLHFSCTAAMTELLLRHGADIYAELSKDAKKWTPAFSALWRNAYGAMHEILKADAAQQRALPNSKDYNGSSMGHMALSTNSLIPMALLRAYGLDGDISNANGRTVRDMCGSVTLREVLDSDPAAVRAVIEQFTLI